MIEIYSITLMILILIALFLHVLQLFETKGIREEIQKRMDRIERDLNLIKWKEEK